MRFISVGLLCGAALIGGCGVLGQHPGSTEPGVPRQASSGAAADSKQQTKPQLPALTHDQVLSASPRLSELPGSAENAPDAVIKLDPTTGTLTGAMEARLAGIAAETAKDERLLVRLESYVPSSASSALAIGIAERALHKVRDRLLGLGVQPRRIMMSSFGGEHDERRDVHQHWVDIYLIQPGGYPVAQPGNKAGP